MDTSVHSPCMGSAVTPAQAQKLFEFFRSGTHREVLLLGDLLDQPVHYVRSKGHKVLCGARQGVCELCEKAAESDDVSTQQTEYYAPSFVRAWKEREFHQRVAVFSYAAGAQVRELIPEGMARGQRLEVCRKVQGTSSRYVVKALPGLPRGFPSMLPPAFDLVPFFRARFGRRQEPGRPLVLLPSFKCEAVNATGGRPRPLDLSVEDCRPDPDDLLRAKAALQAKLAEYGQRQPEPEAAAPQEPLPPPPPPGTSVPAAATDPTMRPAPRRSATPTPELAVEALRRRAALAKSPEQLTADEAVEFHRVTDYMLSGVTAPLNGHAGAKGGAR